MNRAFRLVWNDALGAFVAVAEHVSGRGKGRSGSSKAVAGAVLAGAALSAFAQQAPPAATALPQGGVVTQGQAQWTQSGARLDVNQSSNRAAINWQSFDIGAQAQVRINQPGAGSVALNRVVGGDVSQVFGKLSSNGQVVLVNPNGIVFGQGAQVDVGGLVASTLSLADDDFMAGRMRFTRGATAGAVVNQGRLSAAAGGYAALLAPEVRNEGVVSARLGTVALAGGDAVTLHFDGAQLLGIKVEASTLRTLIENRQALVAEGGQVILAAGAARQLQQQAVAGGSSASQMLEQDGVVRLVSNTGSISAQAGRVQLEGGNLELGGSIAAREGGRIQVQGDYVGQSGTLDVSSTRGVGGAVQVQAETVVQTAQAAITADGGALGGRIAVTGSTGAGSASTIYSSGRFSARSGAGQGGSIDLTAASVQLRAATLDASGAAGGRVRVGGGFHGADADLGNATTVGVNASTVLRADATGARGDGGQVVVWSDASTQFAGAVSAHGGSQAGAGGQAEVSGKQDLVFQGRADLGSHDGRAGQLLLDPRNIIIDNAGSSLASLDLADPTPSATNGFGTFTQVLGNGNVIISAPNASTGGTTATGAVYLFDSLTGALLANLRGGQAGDQAGSGGVQVLVNGNYLVLSPKYGTVSGVNTFSLATGDPYSSAGASAFAIQTGSTASAGAITWQSAAGSGSASIGSGNSLVGSTANTDSVTSHGYSGLAVTNGSSVTITANDRLGNVTTYDVWGGVVAEGTTRIVELTDGNVAIAAPNWFNGRGAVAWMNGSTGALANAAAGGAVSSATALVGSTGIRSLAPVDTDSNGKSVYVIGLNASLPFVNKDSGNNNLRTAPPGAAGDAVGSTLTALSGGAYVVSSPQFTDGASVYAGAASFGAAGGSVGAVSSSNSLVGSHSYDFVSSGGIQPVGSGQGYLVASPYWADSANGTAGRFLQNSPNGAVTWVNAANGNVFGLGATGGAVDGSNSLIGGVGDLLGSLSNGSSSPTSTRIYNGGDTLSSRATASSTGVKLLKNGNYLVVDTDWNSGLGAVAFGTGSTGLAGSVSASNALVGASAGDGVGSGGVVELSGSHYLVLSPNADVGAVDGGAATWGSGTAGITGALSASNSLYGTTASSRVGSGGAIAVGTPGGDGLRPNAIVLSPQWGNRSSDTSTVSYGAVTWIDGSNGQATGQGAAGGAVSSSNSLVGSHDGDYVGSLHYADQRATASTSDGSNLSRVTGAWNAVLSATVDLLANGDFLVRSPGWDGGKGAVTWGSGSTGLAGAVSSANSLVGSTADVVSTSSSVATRGGLSFTDTTYRLTTTGDHVGLVGQALANGNYVAISPYWNGGRGAVTWVGSGNRTGTVSAANSLVGSTPDTYSDVNQSAITATGDRLGTLPNTNWVVPVVSETTVSGNTHTTVSLLPVGPYSFGSASDVKTGVGFGAGANITMGKSYSVMPAHNASLDESYGYLSTNFLYNGYPIVQQLANGNVLVASPGWNNTGAAQAGAITWINGATGALAGGGSGGTLSASNSLVGSHAGDVLGFRLPVDGVTELGNGNFVLLNPQWWDERGAVTWGSGTAGVTGTVGSANSLVGDTGSGSLGFTVPNAVYKIVRGNVLTADWVDRSSDNAGDRVGAGGATVLADGNAVIGSPLWQQGTPWSQSAAPDSLGAATWLNGANGQLRTGAAGGSISAANSLVGTQAGDAVGYSAWVDPSSGLHYIAPGVTALDAGRYVVASPWWSNGATSGVGAVTFSAVGGIAGAVSATNSLVGATAGDHVGRSLSSYDPYTFGAQIDSGVVVLNSTGGTHYMVRSVDWTSTYGNGGATPAAGAGAVTWVDGSTGRAFGESAVGAVVSDANSLTGSSAGDAVGGQSIALKRNVSGSLVATGDLLMLSNYAFCGVAGAGAITLFSGAHGTAGPVSWRNSLIGAASAADGLATTGFDGWSFATDVRAAVLPAAVTSAEQVAWRPLVWAAPNTSSGSNASHAYGLTLLADSAATPTTVDQVNGSGGNANWAGSLFAGNGTGLTSLGLSSGTLGFAANAGADVVITPAALTALLNAGTSVTLQANNDITVLRDVVASAGGAGGNLTLEAGRSIHLRANIGTDGGNFAAHANLSNGVVDADCSVCTAILTQKAGTTVSTGAGNAEFTIAESSSKTYNDAGTLRLASVDATQVLASNAGVDASNQGQGVRFQPGAVVGNSGTEYLTLRARGTSALGGGLVVGSDTQLVGAPWAVMWASASLDSLAVTFGDSTSTGFAMTAGEMGQLIQHTSGFGGLIFGGGGQAGLTTIANVDFTQASMQRGGGALDLSVVFETGSGGIDLTGSLKSGADAGRGLELTSWGGNINLASTSSLVATSPGMLSLRAPSGGSITQVGGSTLTANRVNLDSDGSIALSNGNNSIGTLTGQAGSLDLKVSGSLTLGVSGGGGLQVDTGAVIRTVGATADLTLDMPVGTNSGDLVLAAGRNFVNNNTVDTGLSVGTGRYLVYSATPAGTTEGMTGYGKHYAQAYSAGSTPGYAGSGNWFLYSTAPTLSVTVGSGSTITYGDPGSVPGVSVTGFIDGDTQASATTGSLNVTTGGYTPSGAGFIPVGTYAVNLTGQGTFASSLGYQISVTTGSSNFVVNPKAINVTGLSAASKVYDGTTTAQVTGSAAIAAGGSTSGDGKALDGDVISISGTGSGAFADRHAGTAKSVTLSGLTLGGADAGNYTISAGSVQADITPKALTVGGLSVASSKVYDRSTAATVLGSGALLASEAGGAGSTADGKPYSGDTISLSGSARATYDSALVASASLVQFGGLTLAGANAGNYSLSFGTQAATITPKALTVTGTTVANKVYDGGTAATLSGGSLAGVVNGDTVTLTQAGSFADRNVGTAKAVTAADILGGASADNYTLTQPTALTADITPKALTVTGTTVANKVYDGGVAATLAGGSLLGLVNGDTVTLTEAGQFADRNAGTAKAVVAADTLGGGDAGNYTVTQPTGLTADITPKAVTVTGTTVANKVYDGGTAATLSGGSLSGLVNGDAVVLSQAGQFADRNAGTAKAVTAADSLSGSDAGNYALTQPTGLVADITPKALTVTGTTVASKVYDGGLAAVLAGGSLSGLVNGDTVTLTEAGQFADKNVGQAKAVTAADSLGGTDAGNYSLAQPTGLTGAITPKSVTVTGTAVATKVYDGGVAATLAGGSLVGLVNGDTVTLTEAGQFADRNAGTAKAVEAADTLGGTDAGNYSLSQPSGLTGTITPKALAVAGTSVADKVYDGTTTATLTGGSLLGVLGGDAVSLVQAGDFADRNAGASKAVVAADTLAGADAGNYSVSQPTGLSATISARAVTVTGTVVAGKTYDGDTAATVTGGSVAGLVGGDAVSLVQSGHFADKNVGTGKAVTVTDVLAGASAGNYSLAQPVGLTADITPRALTVTGLQAQDKVYDGTLAAQVSAQGVQWQGLVAGDQVRVDSASGSFADKNAGVGKVVAVLASLGGVDLGNYTVTVQSQSSAAITPRGLTVTADDQHKVYGDADPALTYRVGGQGLVAGDSVAGSFAGQLAADTGAQAAAGSHAITLGTLSVDANYRITQFVPATLAVDKAPLTLSFNPQTKVYGAADPAATWSVDASQLKYGDGSGVVQLVSVSTAQGAQATAGTHAISGTATASNYQVSVRDGVLTVTQAPLTVTADDKTKTAGEQDPVLTWSLDASQLRYQDTAAVVQNASLSAPTGAGTPPGNYAIQIQGATAQNYALTLVDGVLTVKPSPAVKSENLQVQVNETPPATLAHPTVTQPVLNAPLPPAGGSGMGPAGSLTVLGGGVAAPLGVDAGTPGAAPGPAPAPAPAAAAPARLMVLQPVLQMPAGDLARGIAIDRLFSPPAGVQVTYSAKLADGQPLPGWLRFDPVTGQLQGQRPAGVHVVDVEIVAQTSDGQSARAHIRVGDDR